MNRSAFHYKFHGTAKIAAGIRNGATTKSHPARLGNAHSYELHGLSSENPLSGL
jgi:hypothetical protein